MYSELRTKIGKGKETVGVVETLRVFPVAAFYFAVVAGRVWTDQLVPDPKACSGQLKACGQVSFAIGETGSPPPTTGPSRSTATCCSTCKHTKRGPGLWPGPLLDSVRSAR